MATPPEEQTGINGSAALIIGLRMDYATSKDEVTTMKGLLQTVLRCTTLHYLFINSDAAKYNDLRVLYFISSIIALLFRSFLELKKVTAIIIWTDATTDVPLCHILGRGRTVGCAFRLDR
jgi:hypothetical protein